MTEKFIGSSQWTQVSPQDRAVIERAVLRTGQSLALDFLYNGRRYAATLQMESEDIFKGTHKSIWEGQEFVNDISCRLFRSPEGVFLFGEWEEDHEIYTWWADLESVDRFDDQMK